MWIKKLIRVYLFLFIVSFQNADAVEVEYEALNIPVQLGKSLTLKCSVSRASNSSQHFRWKLNDQFVQVDEVPNAESSYMIETFTEDFLVNKVVSCHYGVEGSATFNSSFFKEIFQYVPYDRSMTYSYVPCTNSVRFTVLFPKVFPIPKCDIFQEAMTMEVKEKGPFFNVTFTKEWPVKNFRCIELNPECYMNDSFKIPNGPVEKDCHGALQQSYWGISLSIIYVLIEILILVFIRMCCKGEESDHDDLDWSLTTKIQYLSAFASLAGNPFLYGYNLAVLNNPAVEIAKSLSYFDKGASVMDVLAAFDEDAKWNCVWSLGMVLYVLLGIFGVMCANRIANKYGRKRPLMINSIVTILASCLGLCIMWIPRSYKLPVLLAHLGLMGFSCGLGLVLSGMYTMEISKFTVNRVKGAFGTYDRWFHFTITLGIVFSSVLGLSTVLGNGDHWPWLLALNIVPAMFNWLLYWCPESPIFVGVTQDVNGMKQELRKIYKTDQEVNKKVEILKNEMKRLKKLELTSVMHVLRNKRIRVGLIVVCFLHAAQQLSGINIIVSYSSFVYQYAGVQFELAEWIVFGTSLMNCISTFITLSTRQSRRRLLLSSACIMGLAMFLQFVVSNLCQGFQKACPFFSITAISLYVVAFSVGLDLLDIYFFFNEIQMYMQSFVHIPYLAIVFILLTLIYYGVPETVDLQVADIETSQQYKFWKKFLPNSTYGTAEEQQRLNQSERD